jgi:hypothetical protein
MSWHIFYRNRFFILDDSFSFLFNVTRLDTILLVFFKLLLPLSFSVPHQFSFSTYPLVRKIFNGVSVPRGNSPTERSDNFPISILPVLDNVIFVQIADYIAGNNLISHCSGEGLWWYSLEFRVEPANLYCSIFFKFLIAYAMDCL